MKKFYLIALCILVIQISSMAQPVLIWEHNYGGSDFDQPFGTELTMDKGIISGGHSISPGGSFDITSNQGDYDYWILRLDKDGNKVWSVSYGGTVYDKCRYATENPDGTILAFGSVRSNDVDVAGSGHHGGNDYWALKLDSAGQILWKKCYGGTGDEGGRSAIRVSDGNYICAGYSTSNDGDKTVKYGSYDVWLVKVDPDSGSIIWEKTYGGSKTERVRSLVEWPDHNLVFSGNTESTNYDLAGTVTHGDEDVYACRIDSNGNVIWAVQYGGPGPDRAYHVARDWDGNVIVTAKDSANGGNVTNNHGQSDVWLLKLSYADGSLIWEKSFGGTGDDEGFKTYSTSDHGYMVGATTESNDGDSPGVRGLSDYWIFKLDSNLNIEWTKTDGGGGWDHLNDILLNEDGTVTGVGFSGSDPGPNSETGGNYGSFDSWFVNIGNCDTLSPIISSTGNWSICTGGSITLSAPEGSSYLWNTGSTTQSITVNTAGTYSVTMSKWNNKCVSISPLVTTTIAPPPTAPTINYIGNLLISSQASGFQWFINGILMQGENNDTLIVTQPATYYVVITDANGCTASSAPVTTTGISELNTSFEFSLYPNPSDLTYVNLYINALKASNIELTVYNSYGQKVYNKALNQTANNSVEKLIISSWQKGVYFVELKNKQGEISRKKLVIE